MAFEIAKKIISGRKAIAVSGTPERLVAADTYCFEVDVCADTGNTNAVVVGNSNVNATPGSQVGTVLLPGEVVKMHVDNVNKIWGDVITNGEKICYTYYVQ